jgi:hypothetical protein
MVATIQYIIRKYHLLILLCIVGIVRLTFIGQGYLSFPDENRYVSSIQAVEQVLKGDFHSFWELVFETAARPGDTLVNLIPAAIQVSLQKYLSIPSESQFSFMVVKGVGNVAVSLLILLLFYKISERLFRNTSIVLISTVVYALLVNSNIYLRHLFPYDISLLMYLYCLFVFLTKKIDIWLMFFIGCISGFAYTVYPGYFWFIGIVFLVSMNLSETYPKKLLNGMVFFIGTVIPVVILQLISLCAKYSYFHEMYFVSKSIIQGSFDESPYFGPLYLIQVEYSIGIVLLLMFVVYLVCLWIPKIPINKKVRGVEIPAIIMYLFYVMLGFVFHQMVFYGRILHGFMPFIVWGGFSVIDSIKSTIIRSILLSALIICSFISFGKFYVEYQNIGYPYDVLTRYHIQTSTLPVANILSESYEYKFQYETPPLYTTPITPYTHVSDNPTLINFHFFWPVMDYYYFSYKPEAHQKKIFSVLHFQSYPAYTFEGFLPEEREVLIKRPYIIQIYENE